MLPKALAYIPALSLQHREQTFKGGGLIWVKETRGKAGREVKVHECWTEEPGNLWFMFKGGWECGFPMSGKRQTDGVFSWFPWASPQKVLAA